jgi:hypothetical protein
MGGVAAQSLTLLGHSAESRGYTRRNSSALQMPRHPPPRGSLAWIARWGWAGRLTGYPSRYCCRCCSILPPAARLRKRRYR